MAHESPLTHKCDVYAFGVVLLELISGEEPLMDRNGGGGGGGCRRVSVIETAREAVSSGGGLDRRSKDSFPMDMAEKMVKVELECVEEDPDIRPDMGRVAVKSWGFVGDVPVGLDVVAARECAAIREGLILAVQLGFNGILVATDLKEVV
ncbi:unnamed protein product [Prunus armeniaca]|uniref:Protein kinase domain-containing protein n=1 Tax=Prunus armeniaca TaxID=36596 RepID=A0A6J5WKL4_PRUAR|nr:unnamed protein product [Prunus armeniaca]CAB4300913.1 unnamed protein product [Prunus armeniaca]